MLSLLEYRNRAQSFADLVTWAALVDEGVLMNKDTSFLMAYRYFGPDMDSAGETYLEDLSLRANTALSRLDDGWSLHVDVLRRPSTTYPESTFPDVASQLIDDERKAAYQREGSHYENEFVMTFCYLPSQAARSGLFNLVSDEDGTAPANSLEAQIARFKQQVEDIVRPFKNVQGFNMRPLDSEELLSYLYFCMTGVLRPLKMPAVPMYLDATLAREVREVDLCRHDFIGGVEPRIGKRHIRVVSVQNLPMESHPGILDVLSSVPVSYRWNTRFIALSQAQGHAEVTRNRNVWYSSRKSVAEQFKGGMGSESPFENGNAVNMAVDALQAQEEAAAGTVKFGYYTCTVVLTDTDKEAVDAAAEEIVKRIESRIGFTATVEELNAVEAYLGSLPGHRHENVRKPLLHTWNLADLLPLTAVYPGSVVSPNPFLPKHSPALIHADTTGNTPFRLNLHVGDVGHTAVLGPTGAGKSTLLGLIAAQFFRYPDAQVFFFDKGYSSYIMSTAAGGAHYDILGEDSALTFYPLQSIDTPQELAWAADWVETLFALQGAKVDVFTRKAIFEALTLLANDTVDRSISALVSKFPTSEHRAYLMPYCFDGQMGTLLDARSDSLRDGRFQVFELEHLMAMGGERADKWVIPVLLYLFRQIEKRLDGRPSLIVLDEAWLMLAHPVFQSKIREWLKVLRKANCAVIFATQSVSDVANSAIKDVIFESCPTKILLPNKEARTTHSVAHYTAMGLTEKEIEILALATPKEQYFFKSSVGKRLISLNLGPVALSFIGASGKEDVAKVRTLQAEHGNRWVSKWLESRDLSDWAEYAEELRAA